MFTPGQVFNATSDSHAIHNTSQLSAGPNASMTPGNHARVSPLLANSIPDVAGPSHALQAHYGAVGEIVNSIHNAFGPDTGTDPNVRLQNAVVDEGIFTTDEPVTRAYMISNVPRDTPVASIFELFSVRFHTLMSEYLTDFNCLVIWLTIEC